MNRIYKPLLTLTALLLFSYSNAQVLSSGEAVPKGAIVYSLPVTSFLVTAEATHESFIAGPYAKFAQKYLGIQARENSGEFYTLSSVELNSFVEADRTSSIALNLGSNTRATANFLEMMSQGLVIWSDAGTARQEYSRFPGMKDITAFNSSMASSNLTSVNTTLYKTVKTSSGMERVPVQQTQVVEKSIEKRAEETANAIFRIRTKRMEIITGETDAVFSGEALKAAIEEMNRLEEEYLSLFIGKSVWDKQKLSFDVLPVKENTRQIYVAFRISDSQGLLPADNVAGRPVVLEFLKENGQPATSFNMDLSAEKGRVLYRVPEIMISRISDGQTVLLQTRVPLYQFGKVLSFPVDIAIGK
ncbi:MAG: DUF4831 family protein [Bacteroidales bacterium]|jgi:hypothetical protein|nr:DUF4831 family protein [Bacteroidales bacterium]